MPLNQFVPVCPNSCTCHSRCTGTKCSGCARHKVETHRETGTMWRDALQIAGWDAHVVQPALIAAGISNYGCHTPADAPWEKYSCICMDGLSCTLLWCTGRLADTNFWLSMSLLNTLKNYGTSQTCLICINEITSIFLKVSVLLSNIILPELWFC